MYNLLKQELSKKLMTNCKWVSSMAIHPEGLYTSCICLSVLHELALNINIYEMSFKKYYQVSLLQDLQLIQNEFHKSLYRNEERKILVIM